MVTAGFAGAISTGLMEAADPAELLLKPERLPTALIVREEGTKNGKAQTVPCAFASLVFTDATGSFCLAAHERETSASQVAGRTLHT